MSETTAGAQRSELRELIRGAMKARGITSVDGPQGLARQAGVARNTIYAWEGGAYPRIGELEKVARFLGLATWQLLRAWEDGVAVGRSADDRLGSIERKLDLLLATGGIDPVDAEDEAEARRLMEKALALIAQREQAGAES